MTTTMTPCLDDEANEWPVQEIKQAVAEANSAGPNQFVDNDTVMAWMETWGTDDESQPPP